MTISAAPGVSPVAGDADEGRPGVSAARPAGPSAYQALPTSTRRAVLLIDHTLNTFAGRQLLSGALVRDLLLDIRSALADEDS